MTSLAKAASAPKETRGVLSHELRRYEKKLRRVSGPEAPDDADLHALRVAGKRLRYTSELFADLVDDRLAGLAAELGELQDVLGDLHDADVAAPPLAERLAATAESDPARPGLAYVLADLRAKHSEALRRLETDWFPKRVAKLVRRYGKVLET